MLSPKYKNEKKFERNPKAHPVTTFAIENFNEVCPDVGVEVTFDVFSDVTTVRTVAVIVVVCSVAAAVVLFCAFEDEDKAGV